MRRFNLQRNEDASGVSGVGVVAQGVEFDDGSCAMRWLTATASTAVYASADDLVTIHGHEGRTQLVWIDPLPTAGPRDIAAGPIEIEFRPGDSERYTALMLTRRQEVIDRLRKASS